jgi:hypothetical protein
MEGGLYICLPSESNGPNMLDEPLKDFIVFPCLLTFGSVLGVINLGIWATRLTVKLYNLCRV